MTSRPDASRSTSLFFVIAGLYEACLGLSFLVFPAVLFTFFQVTPPNHWGYVQFPGALLLVFALMFFQIARAPHQRHELILYGILLKLAYCGVTGYYWLNGPLPMMWQPFTLADALFLVGFVLIYRMQPRSRSCVAA